MPPCTNHRSVCWAPSCQTLGGTDRVPDTLLCGGKAGCQPQVLPWHCQPEGMKKPAQVTDGEEAELGPFDPRACSGFHHLLVTLCLRCHGQIKTRPPAGLHTPSILQKSGRQGWSALWPIHIPYVKSTLQTQVGIFKKWKASFSGVGGYVGNASEQLACKLKDTISHYWGVGKGLSDSKGEKAGFRTHVRLQDCTLSKAVYPDYLKQVGKKGSIFPYLFFYILMAICTFHNWDQY